MFLFPSLGVQKRGIYSFQKGCGSREPQPFWGNVIRPLVDPLFYLSSFYPFGKTGVFTTNTPVFFLLLFQHLQLGLLGSYAQDKCTRFYLRLHLFIDEGEILVTQSKGNGLLFTGLQEYLFKAL